MSTDKVSRGEIWSINLGSTWGHEQAGTRYGLIISDNGLNHNNFGVVLVIPTTTKNIERPHPFRIIIESHESGLDQKSALMCEQIVRLDPQQRLFRKYSTLSRQTIVRVEIVLLKLLGIVHPYQQ